MFGTLKPHSCGLACDRRHAYATFYCGLCKGLGDHFGTATRALLTYDAVFLALVVDGLMVERAAPDTCRCPMLPLVHRPTVRPDSVAMRYASAMQLLLVDQFLADRSEDGKRVAKVARPLLSSRVTHAYAMLGELGGIANDSTEIYNAIRKMREVVHTYGWYMRKYVKETKAKGAVPIICSWYPVITGRMESNKIFEA